MPTSPRSAAVLVVVALLAGPTTADGADRVVRYSVHTMGTIGTVAVVADDSLAALDDARAGLAAFAAVDRRFSNWDRRSEISRVNAALDAGPVRLSSEATTVIGTALRIAAESKGAFDPTVEPLVRLWGFLGGRPAVPDSTAVAEALERVGHERVRLDGHALTASADGVRIDLGGIAKGRAVDDAIAVLGRRGVENALVDVSGTMRALGRPTARPHWTLGIRDPETDDAWFGQLRLDDDAVATSGNYEQFVARDGTRHGHVLDPRTGWSVQGLTSVTIVAPTALEADAWATAILALGSEEGRRVLATRDDLTGVLVQSASAGRYRVWVEDSLRDRFDLVTGAKARFMVEWFGGHRDRTR
ncbi:MAG TPA: FAD:protein FMN transferase [Candidatus Krumholzibacteria bacterium]|nr:FAD:protein FMN transferase [Candidatus Krumholzibacteria bacterium]